MPVAVEKEGATALLGAKDTVPLAAANKGAVGKTAVAANKAAGAKMALKEVEMEGAKAVTGGGKAAMANKGAVAGKAALTKGAMAKGAVVGGAAGGATVAGGTIWTGQGWSLGLGLGLGAWGPVILAGIIGAGIYGYMKSREGSADALADELL